MGNSFGDIRLHKVGCAYCHRTGACEHKLYSVLGAHNAAHADDGNVHSLRHLVHQAHCHRAHSRAAEAAGDIAQHGALAFDIYLGAQKRVDHGNSVCACSLHSLGHHYDVGDVGRQLSDNHFAGISLYLAHNCGSRLGHSAKDNAALLDVGAGDVDFYSIHAINIQFFGNSAIFLWRVAVDVDDHWHVVFAQLWQGVLQEIFAAGVFEADAVEHA